MNHLGEKGNFSLEAEVKKVLAAVISSSDVDNWKFAGLSPIQ
jgi:hypothetical protein